MDGEKQMAWDDYDDYDGGMVSDSAFRKSKKSRKPKVPNLKFLIPKGRRRRRRTLHSDDFSSAMAGLTMGMLFIFPVLALLIKGSFISWLVVVGIFALIGLVLTMDFIVALILMGAMVIFTLLGFISLGFYTAIFS